MCVRGPGTSTRAQSLVSKGTDTIPGKAAALYEDKETKTYNDQANFGHGWTCAEAWMCFYTQQAANNTYHGTYLIHTYIHTYKHTYNTQHT